ncbi:MAG: hypothetical protein H6745_15735 [Deltaproteobacteria bacterium]|nr:hypothetical protein [Deltaproteobacteria bacterium]
MKARVPHITDPALALALDGEGAPREVARTGLEPVAVGAYARIGGRFHGVRASVEGPVFFVDDADVSIIPGRFRADLEREPGRVAFVLFDEDRPVYEMECVDEGGAGAFFAWLAAGLHDPAFFARHRVAAR